MQVSSTLLLIYLMCARGTLETLAQCVAIYAVKILFIIRTCLFPAPFWHAKAVPIGLPAQHHTVANNMTVAWKQLHLYIVLD